MTDSALAQLELDDLLVELLDRVRSALEVDMAAILLLDPRSRQLVTATIRGLTHDVRTGRRTPLARGFAGRVVAEGQPVVVEHDEQGGMIDPFLRESGIRSELGVPLIAAGSTLGVLCVGARGSRLFSESDADLLRLAADRAALAVHAQNARADQSAARALARSLIPTQLPEVPGLELAARYLPNERGGVGGDWYDVFSLPTKEWCVVMGDVAGHGLPAAVIMGRLRSALRAYALEGVGPGEVLERLDAKIQHFEAGAMATVSYGILDPSMDRIHLSLAGHFPPVVANGPGPAVMADVPTDPPLGAVRGLRRRTSTVPIRPGSLICFYTDGLIERRDSDIDADLKRLCDTVVAQPAEDACTFLLEKLLDPTPTNDDVALLTLYRPL